ncbi:hypothetical protein IMF23_04265 [Chelatococcus daeguensis]|uniref:hypothetical protein n=1 Tax=Chelatococcus daeguensis TaxID=444444 RepID=UPI0007AC05BC|nr:hypothetical protein [Chelatococcus daeguensis]KZE34093.1 hypothetical protein AVW15_17415 [Chelatococcus daeguensis]MBM3082650.1 hypothetical protein [Chelatococcus daeguensis]
MFCPSKDDLIPQALALLPRGRAWGTHEGGPGPGTTLYRYWAAVCDLFAFVCRRLCALRLEFWCATHRETSDLWLEEYGLPDPCDPYPDLCAKVRAQGGARCEDLAALVAPLGWSISCADAEDACGAMAGCAPAGCSTAAGAPPRNTIIIYVDIDNSPAFVGDLATPPLAGRAVGGGSLACDPDLSALQCVLDRVVHAHLEVQYVIIPPPVYILVNDEEDYLDTGTGLPILAE